MTSNPSVSLANAAGASGRRIVRRTAGHGHGFITRLMSPSDLGEVLKPFVFLDIFNVDQETIRAMKAGGGMPIHPHSGIATVTVFTEGCMIYDDLRWPPETGQVAKRESCP
jgi:redox-sensitive bicupin YhaK (pirin superfamily)